MHFWTSSFDYRDPHQLRSRKSNRISTPNTQWPKQIPGKRSKILTEEKPWKMVTRLGRLSEGTVWEGFHPMARMTKGDFQIVKLLKRMTNCLFKVDQSFPEFKMAAMSSPLVNMKTKSGLQVWAAWKQRYVSLETKTCSAKRCNRRIWTAQRFV